MPGHFQLNWNVPAEMNRREFISAVGMAAGGASALLWSAACGGDPVQGLTAPTTPTGFLRGRVVDLNGYAQAIGRIFLLTKTGLNDGSYADVDDTGDFDFGAVAVGDYQVQYWGANLAHVPDSLANPVSIAVRAGAPSVVEFTVVAADTGGLPDRAINIGEYFFQEQPSGLANATVVVKVGTLICWYNVGVVLHSATGGPWGDSGPLAHGDNYMWRTTAVGEFPYRCGYHGTRMVATLEVVP